MEQIVGGTAIDPEDERRSAFEALAREQLPRLYGLARRLTNDGAEDLVQECLLKAYRSFGALQATEAGPAWLQRILVNAFRDRLRKEARSVKEVDIEEIDDFSLYRTIADEDPFPYSDSLHVDVLQAFGREDVHAVLTRMPEIYRAPLVLRYMQGFVTKEIARMMDTPLGTTLARLHRGRKLFEREMWVYAEEAGLLEQEGAP
ncbi:MAG: sigma-70 family RNA polymerase sigma factor [Actinobacteria bacterium]|nr:sigma-70 family RNA polymerase sigma factor [Actinomycetota bacterium]